MAATFVRRVEADGRVAWRKTYSDGGTRRRIAVLRWLARRLGANALLAPIPLGPAEACRTEQAMIRRLAAWGANVPEILHAGEAELLLGDLGPTLSQTCRDETNPRARAALVALGLSALLDLHRRGGYLSQAFARNMTLRDGRVGFIDLEEDPGTMMSRAAAQARDVLFYAHSTARFLADQPGVHAGLLSAHLAEELPAVRAEVAHTARRLAVLAPVCRWFGGRARAVAEALVSLRQASA
jgi:hypothetical protein